MISRFFFQYVKNLFYLQVLIKWQGGFVQAHRSQISVSTIINIARGNEIEVISSLLSREGHMNRRDCRFATAVRFLIKEVG